MIAIVPVFMERLLSVAQSYNLPAWRQKVWRQTVWRQKIPFSLSLVPVPVPLSLLYKLALRLKENSKMSTELTQTTAPPADMIDLLRQMQMATHERSTIVEKNLTAASQALVSLTERLGSVVEQQHQLHAEVKAIRTQLDNRANPFYDPLVSNSTDAQTRSYAGFLVGLYGLGAKFPEVFAKLQRVSNDSDYTVIHLDSLIYALCLYLGYFYRLSHVKGFLALLARPQDASMAEVSARYSKNLQSFYRSAIETGESAKLREGSYAYRWTPELGEQGLEVEIRPGIWVPKPIRAHQQSRSASTKVRFLVLSRRLLGEDLFPAMESAFETAQNWLRELNFTETRLKDTIEQPIDASESCPQHELIDGPVYRTVKQPGRLGKRVHREYSEACIVRYSGSGTEIWNWSKRNGVFDKPQINQIFIERPLDCYCKLPYELLVYSTSDDLEKARVGLTNEPEPDLEDEQEAELKPRRKRRKTSSK